MKIKNFLSKAILLLSVYSVEIQAQDIISIRGIVKDSATREGIFNVQVIIKNSTIGTTTNSAGRFDLTFKQDNFHKSITFLHIAYDSLTFPLEEIQSPLEIFLNQRVIPLLEFEVSDKRVYSEIGKDLPQSITVISAEKFEHMSFDDAGELLRNDRSIRVEDVLSGQKTIAIRGGNADETIVMYNGIKLNSIYNNIADISMIDLQDVEKVEIIRGSNTTIYGSGAFAGVINIVPKYDEKHHLKFRQKIGSYDSGQWTLNLHETIGNLSAFVSTRQGASVRLLAAQNKSIFKIRNESMHFTGNFKYQFSNLDNRNFLYGTLLTISKNYENERDEETLSNEEKIFSSRYDAYLPVIRDIEFKFSKRSFEQDHSVVSSFGSLSRNLAEESFNISFDKPFEIASVEQRFVYQIESTELDLLDLRRFSDSGSTNVSRELFNRSRHGFVSITKFHQKKNPDNVRESNFDVSFRHEFLKDSRREPLGVVPGDDEIYKQETSFKFAFNISGINDNSSYNTYLSYGTNFKFPTLSQQISSIYVSDNNNETINFEPEKISSKEIGFEIFGRMPNNEFVDNWEFRSNIFSNIYDNKLRVTFPVGVPVPIYDKVSRVKLSGLESNLEVTLYEKRLKLSMGFSKYFISEKSAFPFKYDQKQSVRITFIQMGYSSHIALFREGEQVGWIKTDDELLNEVILPSYSNIDIHLNKTVSWNNYKINLNISGINLISDDLIIQGLALRDRRYYLTVGFKY